ncbi:hypothetical protein CUMW_236930, partial [Citrus unshiu]
ANEIPASPTLKEADGSLTTPIIPLTSEHITEDGIFLLENGEDAMIYIGDRVNSYILDQLFGISLTRFSPQVQIINLFVCELKFVLLAVYECAVKELHWVNFVLEVPLYDEFYLSTVDKK